VDRGCRCEVKLFGGGRQCGVGPSRPGFKSRFAG
jgi:hypothetical protein